MSTTEVPIIPNTCICVFVMIATNDAIVTNGSHIYGPRFGSRLYTIQAPQDPIAGGGLREGEEREGCQDVARPDSSYVWDEGNITYSNHKLLSPAATCMLEVLVGEGGSTRSKLIVASGLSTGRIDVYDMNENPGLLRPQVTIRDIPPVTCMTEIVVEDGNVDSSSCNTTSRTRRLLVVGCSSSSSGELHIWDIEALINSSNTTATASAAAPVPMLVMRCGDTAIAHMKQHHTHVHFHDGLFTRSSCLLVEFNNSIVKHFSISCVSPATTTTTSATTTTTDADIISGEDRSPRGIITVTCIEEHNLGSRIREYLCCLSDNRHVVARTDWVELYLYDVASSSSYTMLPTLLWNCNGAIELSDGRLATCSGSGIHIWDIANLGTIDDASRPRVTGGQFRIINKRCVQSLDYSADCLMQLPQGHIVTWGLQRPIHIWTYDATSCRFSERPIVGATPNIYSVVSLSEGTLLAAATQELSSVHIFDTATCSLIITLDGGGSSSSVGTTRSKNREIRCMVPLCGERLAVGDSSGLVHVWDLPALGDQRWHRRRPLVLLLVAAVARKHDATATSSARTGGHDRSSMAAALLVQDVVRHIASYCDLFKYEY